MKFTVAQNIKSEPTVRIDVVQAGEGRVWITATNDGEKSAVLMEFFSGAFRRVQPAIKIDGITFVGGKIMEIV
jgi:hypothetical protein